MIKELVRSIFSNRKVSAPKAATSYISAEETVNAAKAENLSVCDYVEKIWDQRGQTEKVIENMFSIVPAGKIHSILEIGAGTGRYIEKTLKKVAPISYESYEIAEDWNQYLKGQYPDLKVYQAAGSSLPSTKNNSVDLVTSHGVFVYLPFLVSIEYFQEVIRVLQPGGYFVFDSYTEKCFNDPYLNNWLVSGHRYPVFLGFQFLCEFFQTYQCTFEGSFNNKHGAGISEYLVFKKNK